MAGAHIGPLAEIGLAQNDRARLAQLLRDERVFHRLRSDQRQRSRRGLHAVGCVDVVFDEDGNAVQRPAGAFRLALGIELFGYGKRVRIHFDHAVHRRPALVHGFDARQIFFGEGSSGDFAGVHRRLKIGHGGFIELERGNAWSGCRGCIESSGRRKCRNGTYGHQSGPQKPPPRGATERLFTHQTVSFPTGSRGTLPSTVSSSLTSNIYQTKPRSGSSGRSGVSPRGWDGSPADRPPAPPAPHNVSGRDKAVGFGQGGQPDPPRLAK